MAQALRAVREGLATLREMQANPDPELAITLRGNEDLRWQQTQKKLRQMGRALERVLPKKSHNDFGV